MDTDEERHLLALHLIRELAVHLVAEEEVLYGVAVAEQLDPHALDRAIDEHDYLKQLSARVQALLAQPNAEATALERTMQELIEASARASTTSCCIRCARLLWTCWVGFLP
jgi:hypothetical protein